MYEGSCLCGSVKYEIAGELGDFGYCHCTRSPGALRIRLGSLDTPFTKQPKAHTFVSDKAPWEPLNDGLPQFPEWAPKSVLDQRGSRQDEVKP